MSEVSQLKLVFAICMFGLASQLAAAAPCPQLAFGAPSYFPSGLTTNGLATGDLNGDGKADLVAANEGSGRVTVRFGDGAGAFPSSFQLAVITPSSVAIADLNGDGHLDLVTTSRSNSRVTVWLGIGGGAFGPPAQTPVGSGPSGLAKGDFNGDGNIDLVTSNGGTNSISFLPGNGGGSFPTATNFSIACGSGAFGIIAADFNGDGKRDVATANRGTFNISVLFGNGAGGFAAAVIYATGTHPLLPFALSVLHSRNRGMSYTHLVYHIVFGTKDRAALIGAAWEHDLYRSLAATVGNHKGELIEINGTPDHVHMLVRLLPATAVADFLRELKSVSSKWIRRNHEPRFTWQRRYGAFSVSESDTVAVRDYIRDQKRHHTRRSFDAEYKAILQRHSIEFDERYLWD